MPFSTTPPNTRREGFERTLSRSAILVVVIASPLFWWLTYTKIQTSSAAFAASQLLLVQKVSEFEIHQTLETAIVLSRQAEMFQQFDKGRTENMGKWEANSKDTADNTAEIRADMAQLRNDLVARFGTLDEKIASTAQSLKVNSEVTRAHADTAVKKLNQKVLTGSDAEALRNQAAALKKQNKELKRKKVIFKPFPW
jgi:hypothetical protein